MIEDSEECRVVAYESHGRVSASAAVNPIKPEPSDEACDPDLTIRRAAQSQWRRTGRCWGGSAGTCSVEESQRFVEYTYCTRFLGRGTTRARSDMPPKAKAKQVETAHQPAEQARSSERAR